ncbi:hypothetical protein C7B65_08685 [Phormidesmis priestleyi ULC007]|uniref:Uncharacterized protein n=1 Tax=Phormidesmis priestleyi ULC007 TaxID=1920490 RepID=A0A2T1DHY5_9CYAN|nr:hypothetical protein [Phormidesmis priestleyi]PSB20120.1 hypothetical protein C7B65_08685 [Phormidesmis priestleyi ULC007]PZO49049.1 MAG: hypothetical protein DCF14_15005 [Phormidesmis priestleyi]
MPKITALRWLSRLKVGQKISLGYALALGIAVSGTIVGFGIGNQYRQQASQRQKHTRNEVEILPKSQTLT